MLERSKVSRALRSKKSPKSDCVVNVRRVNSCVALKTSGAGLWGAALLVMLVGCAEKAPPPRFPEAPPPVLAEPIGGPSVVEIYGAGVSTPEALPPALTQAGASEGAAPADRANNPAGLPRAGDKTDLAAKPATLPSTPPNAAATSPVAVPAVQAAPADKRPQNSPRLKTSRKPRRKAGSNGAKERKTP
jgi:hypothetical protein